MKYKFGIIGLGLIADFHAQAIEAGNHLIVEKPLEVTLGRCDKILEAAAGKKMHK